MHVERAAHPQHEREVGLRAHRVQLDRVVRALSLRGRCDRVGRDHRLRQALAAFAARDQEQAVPVHGRQVGGGHVGHVEAALAERDEVRAAVGIHELDAGGARLRHPAGHGDRGIVPHRVGEGHGHRQALGIGVRRADGAARRRAARHELGAVAASGELRVVDDRVTGGGHRARTLHVAD